MAETIIYHGECEHFVHRGIRSDGCLKRYIQCYDYATGEHVTIAICNERVRLELHQHLKGSCGEWTQEDARKAYIDYVESVLSKHLRIFDYPDRSGWSNYSAGRPVGINKRSICLRVSFRPYITKRLSVYDAIKLAVDANKHKPGAYYHSELAWAIKDELDKYLEDNLRSRVSKTKLVLIKRQIKRCQECYGFGDINALIDVFSDILESADSGLI